MLSKKRTYEQYRTLPSLDINPDKSNYKQPYFQQSPTQMQIRNYSSCYYTPRQGSQSAAKQSVRSAPRKIITHLSEPRWETMITPRRLVFDNDSPQIEQLTQKIGKQSILGMLMSGDNDNEDSDKENMPQTANQDLSDEEVRTQYQKQLFMEDILEVTEPTCTMGHFIN